MVVYVFKCISQGLKTVFKINYVVPIVWVTSRVGSFEHFEDYNILYSDYKYIIVERNALCTQICVLVYLVRKVLNTRCTTFCDRTQVRLLSNRGTFTGVPVQKYMELLI